MREFDLVQDLEASLDPVHSLTHPNMDDWNYCGGWVFGQEGIGKIFGVNHFKYVPKTAMETVMLKDSLYCDKKHLEMLKPRYRLDNF